MTIDIRSERQHLLAQFTQSVDPKYQAAMAGTVAPTGSRVYGVRVPRLREIARGWWRDHKDISREDLLALVEALWAGGSREERQLVIFLLERFKRWIPTLTWADFDRWRHDLDNWETTDGMAQWVFGRWLLANPDARLHHLRNLIADEDVWSRRLALIATVWLNRGRKDLSFPDLTLELVDQVKDERHPMITKAVSWALRGLIKKHPQRVAAYLGANREMLAPHAVREVDNKLRTGPKSGKALRHQDDVAEAITGVH